jgi:hypothetical protein
MRYTVSAKKVVYFLIIIIAVTAFALACTFSTVHFFTKATNDRDWNDDQAVLPYAEISGNFVSIHNVRNFSYASTTSFIPVSYTHLRAHETM